MICADICLNKLYKNYSYVPVGADDAGIFAQFDLRADFFDVTYAGIRIWREKITSYYRCLHGCMSVINVIGDNEVSCFLLDGEDSNITAAIYEIKDIFSKEQQSLKFICVPKRLLTEFEKADAKTVNADPAWSDYVFGYDDFLNLSGKSNRAKRYELTKAEEYGNLSVKPLCEDNLAHCGEIFDLWCRAHGCEACSRDSFFGCEKKAFSYLIEMFSHGFSGAVVYDREIPVAFTIEKQYGDRVFCIFQKCAVKIPGLTFYTHYSSAQNYQNVREINWGEDMGIPGIAQLKRKYSPSRMDDKYTVIM